MTPVRRAALLTLLGSSFAAVPALAQTFTTAGPHAASIDTTQYNVMTFVVNGGGGGGGGKDSAVGGAGAAGSSVSGLVQVGPPYATADIVVGAGGGFGANDPRSPTTTPTYASIGAGQGGPGGLNVQSGGGGAGGGASALNIAGSSVWVRAGGGGGGGGGSTGAFITRIGYTGIGMAGNEAYSGPVAPPPSTAANPATTLVPVPALASAAAACAAPGNGAPGNTDAVNGGGAGGAGGTFSGADRGAAMAARDSYWNAAGGLTGPSCDLGPVEGATLNPNGGGAGGKGANATAAAAGTAGRVTVTFSYDATRVPTVTGVDGTGAVTVAPPATLPPSNSPVSYTVTCTPAGGGTALVGNGAAPGPITVSGMVAGQGYDCTAVAQLQDDATGTPSISTLPSPPVAVMPPIAPASLPGITATPGDTTATVTLTPPTTLPLGATVVSYDVTCTGPGGYSQTQTGITPATPTTATFSGMTNGQTYSCTTTANLSGTFGTAGPSPAATVVPNGPIAPVAVPTLNEWMLLLTSAAVAGLTLRRRRSRG